MKKYILLLICLFSLLSANNLNRKIAILDIPDGYDSKMFSVMQAVNVMGIPYIVTDNLEEAFNYSMIITTSKICRSTFESPQINAIDTYIYNGGIFFTPKLDANRLFPVFGISDTAEDNDRYRINFATDMGYGELRWFDDEMEKTISLGKLTHESVVNSVAFTASSADVLATYDDTNEAALTRNTWGQGYAYTFGISFKDIILRNLLDRDHSAQRVWSNGFEPTTDTIYLLLRAIYQTHVDYASYAHTAPLNYETVLMITHDCDSRTAMEKMLGFAEMEEQHNVKTTYLVTTHKFADDLSSNYYTPYIDSLLALKAYGVEIGSHSFGHFPDMADREIFPIGTPITDLDSYMPHFDNGFTQEGTLYGEFGVSKDLLERDLDITVKSFRSGHLAHNKYHINVLDSLGYIYDSTQSANNVLTNFPYKTKFCESFSGEHSKILELPMTISDVPYSDGEHADCVANWLEVINKNKANNSPINLLIHPNRQWKIDKQNELMNAIDSSIKMTGLEDYAEFWLARADFKFETEVNDGNLTLKVYNHNEAFENKLSVVITNAPEVSHFAVVDSLGHNLYYNIDYQSNGNAIVYNFSTSVNNNDDIASYKPVIKTSNYPNPFNPTTTIEYSIADTEDVKIDIYNVKGQKVKTLVNQSKPKGTHSVVWQGKNDENQSVGSGIYFYKVQTKNSSVSKKMLLLK